MSSKANGPWRSSAALSASPGSTTSRSSCRRCRAVGHPAAAGTRGVLARRPAGVIAVFSDLSDTLRDQLRSRGIPLVVVDPTGEPLHDTPSVGATNWSGGLTATRHLLGLGHRRIGVIGGPDWILCSRAGLTAINGDGRSRRARRSAVGEPRAIPRRRGHREGPRPPPPARPTDGHLRRNDLQALGVYQAARELRFISRRI